MWRFGINGDDQMAPDWRRDWDLYGVPFVNRLVDRSATIQCLTQIDFVPRAKWVLSDGVLSAGRFEYAAIMHVFEGNVEIARQMLTGKLHELRITSRALVGQSRAISAMQRRCELLLNWAESCK